MAKRVIQVTKDLFFEYEFAPHRRIQQRRDSVAAAPLCEPELVLEAKEVSAQVARRKTSVDSQSIQTGVHIPFKQVRLKGQVNPLKPPVHVETVLIGRALGQPTGYLAGVGFRIRDDGYVEGEFLHGTEKFNSFEEFERAVTSGLETTTRTGHVR
jgi:hypothetical protein